MRNETLIGLLIGIAVGAAITHLHVDRKKTEAQRRQILIGRDRPVSDNPDGPPRFIG